MPDPHPLILSDRLDGSTAELSADAAVAERSSTAERLGHGSEREMSRRAALERRLAERSWLGSSPHSYGAPSGLTKSWRLSRSESGCTRGASSDRRPE